MLRLTSLVSIVLISALGSQSAAALKDKSYNGIECAYSNISHRHFGTPDFPLKIWLPSATGLVGWGVDDSAGDSHVICPLDRQVSEGYSYEQLSFVVIYGIGITNPRLCRNNSPGSSIVFACGANAVIGSNKISGKPNAWLLYKPVGDRTDFPFLNVSVSGSNIAIKNYIAFWDD